MTNRQKFGVLDDGAEASLFTIVHPSGLRAAITDLGAALVSLEAPDRDGRVGEVVLGLPRAEDYVAHAGCFFGATVGRFGNRIAGGQFSLEGRAYQLTTNNAPGGVPCHLHGGAGGFHRRLWAVEAAGEDFVRFLYRSTEGEEGYPGNLTAAVTYRVGPGGELTWTAEARTDAPTIVNLVHHPYWNLAGPSAPTIDKHRLQLFASAFLPVGPDKIPTGEQRSVEGTALDFRQPRPVCNLSAFDYDHCWILDRAGSADDLVLAARLVDPESGRVLEVFTNQPGIQFYDGHSLDGSAAGRDGRRFEARAGLCLEPQNFPDAPNHPNFPSSRLEPGGIYVKQVRYKLGAG